MFRPTQPDTGIAIVGGGIAGQALCEELRARDASVAITLICGERHLPYDRVRLSELLVGEDAPGQLQIRPDEWYDDQRVELLTGTRVTGLDTATTTVTFENGETRSFGAIALATGSQPLMPPVPGIDAESVIAYRDPEDCARIRQAAGPGTRVAVIGGGLLGLEAARGAQARGAAVTVVHLVDRLMERQLDHNAAGMLQRAFDELGLDVLLEHSTTAFDQTPDGLRVRFAGGTHLECDLAVVSIGIRPEVTLARAAGLDCERGVVVDDRLRTSAENVVALGECAEHAGTVYGLVAPIFEQSRIAADTLLQREGALYSGSLQWAKLKVAGIDLVAIGDIEGDRAAVSADHLERTYRKLVTRNGRAAGAILFGDIRGSEDLLNAISTGEEVADELERLAAAAAMTAADLPDSAQVCNCNGVCKGDIVAAVHDGLTSAREVITVTRAGTGCGTCRPLVKEIVASITGGAGDEPAYLCPCLKQTREEIADEIRTRDLQSVSAVASECGTGRRCGTCKPGVAYLVSEIQLNQHEEERGARFINDRVHANIQKDGSFSVVPRMYGGVTTPDELRRIADVADRYEVKMVKVTGGQRIDLLGVRKSDLPKIWEDLGMRSGFAYSKAVRTVKSCVGSTFCRFGLDDSISMAQEMERDWEGLHTPHKVKCGSSGCPRNCAEATVKDIGVVAVEGGWQVHIGGAAGANVRQADILATVETRAEAMRLMTTFLQYYRENGQYLERTYDFVPRLGLDHIREVCLDPELSAGLRERLKIARAAVRDPWQVEGEKPYHRTQFADVVGEDGEPFDLALAAADNGGPS